MLDCPDLHHLQHCSRPQPYHVFANECSLCLQLDNINVADSVASTVLPAKFSQHTSASSGLLPKHLLWSRQ